eukprot:418178-Ditylum_brightwellii.AAC.1
MSSASPQCIDFASVGQHISGASVAQHISGASVGQHISVPALEHLPKRGTAVASSRLAHLL